MRLADAWLRCRGRKSIGRSLFSTLVSAVSLLLVGLWSSGARRAAHRVGAASGGGRGPADRLGVSRVRDRGALAGNDPYHVAPPRKVGARTHPGWPAHCVHDSRRPTPCSRNFRPGAALNFFDQQQLETRAPKFQTAAASSRPTCEPIGFCQLPRRPIAFQFYHSPHVPRLFAGRSRSSRDTPDIPTGDRLMRGPVEVNDHCRESWVYGCQHGFRAPTTVCSSWRREHTLAAEFAGFPPGGVGDEPDIMTNFVITPRENRPGSERRQSVSPGDSGGPAVPRWSGPRGVVGINAYYSFTANAEISSHQLGHAPPTRARASPVTNEFAQPGA